MAFNRGRGPRFTERLSSDPRFLRARSVVISWAGEGNDRYVRLGFVVFFLGLLVALVALLAGGSRHKPAGNQAARRAGLTTSTATSSVGGIPGLKPMIVRGSVLAGETNAVALQDPVVLLAVDGGGCRNYSVTTSTSSFTVTLPGGCAADGAGVHFEASGTDASGAVPAPQPVCVSSDGRSSASLSYSAGASVEVQLRPGCVAESASLTFTPPQPLVPDDAGRSDLAERLAPGFPGGLHIDLLAAALAAVPGFPGGLKVASVLLTSELPSASAAAMPLTPPVRAGATPAAIPTPPALAGVPPPGGAVTTASVPGASSVNPNAAAVRSGSTGVTTSPPTAPAPSAPIAISAPPIPAPPAVPAPVIIPPVEESPAASDQPASSSPDTTVPAASSPSELPAASQKAMTLDVTVLGRQGAPVTTPRVQAISGQTICADETAADVTDSSVRLSLPGACTDLSAGSTLAFRAAGFDAQAGLVVSPAPSCAVAGVPSGSSTPVAFQPGTSGQQIYLRLNAAQPSAGCPHDDLNSASSMMLSVTVRTAESADPITSPVVRVSVAGKPCAEGASTGSTVAHLSLPPTCGRPGDLLTFEAAGQDTGGAASPQMRAACSSEFGFSSDNQPVPLYQPIAFTPGLRSASLIFASLSGCPNGASVPATPPASTAMSLRLSVIDPAMPSSPVARPWVTAFVAGVPCVRASSVDTPDVVLTLPGTCGTAGAALTFRVSSPDPRFTATSGADVTACAIDPPSPDTTARSFRPAVRQLTLQPGTNGSYALLPGDASCPAAAGTTPATATPTAIASPAATATPALSSSPSPVPAAQPSTPSPVPSATGVTTAPAGQAPVATGGTVTGTPLPTATPVEVRGPDQAVTSPPGNSPR